MLTGGYKRACNARLTLDVTVVARVAVRGSATGRREAPSDPVGQVASPTSRTCVSSEASSGKAWPHAWQTCSSGSGMVCKWLARCMKVSAPGASKLDLSGLAGRHSPVRPRSRRWTRCPTGLEIRYASPCRLPRAVVSNLEFGTAVARTMASMQDAASIHPDTKEALAGCKRDRTLDGLSQATDTARRRAASCHVNQWYHPAAVDTNHRAPIDRGYTLPTAIPASVPLVKTTIRTSATMLLARLRAVVAASLTKLGVTNWAG